MRCQYGRVTPILVTTLATNTCRLPGCQRRSSAIRRERCRRPEPSRLGPGGHAASRPAGRLSGVLEEGLGLRGDVAREPLAEAGDEADRQEEVGLPLCSDADLH